MAYYESDSCSDEGARRLEQRIYEYWLKEGRANYLVTQRKEAGFTPTMRSVRTDVRSNMTNGWPPTKPTVVKDPAASRPRQRRRH